MNNKEILENIKKLSNEKINNVKKPFNTKSIFFIILSLSISTILAFTIIYLLIFFLL